MQPHCYVTQKFPRFLRDDLTRDHYCSWDHVTKLLYVEDITRWREDMDYIDVLMTPFLTNFRRFPITFRRFPKIFKIVLKARRTFPDIYRTFPKITDDCRRLPKTTEEDPKMFRSYTDKFNQFNKNKKREL